MITSASFSKALYPGVSSWFGNDYNDYQTEYTTLFETLKSKRAFEEDVGQVGLGLARKKPEGQAIQYDDMKQSYITRYTHAVFALGFTITREMVEDDLYGVIGKAKAQNLARSMRHTKEIVHMNILNRAFNTSYTGGDGKALAVSDHPFWTGGTWSNVPSVPVDISEAALEQAVIDISKWVDERGLRIMVKPVSLHVPYELIFEVERILNTVGRVGTANNDLNALQRLGMFKNVVYHHFLTDTDAWFIKTDVKQGLKSFNRRPLEFGIDNEFETEAAKFKATERYSGGWSDAHIVYASAGA